MKNKTKQDKKTHIRFPLFFVFFCELSSFWFWSPHTHTHTTKKRGEERRVRRGQISNQSNQMMKRDAYRVCTVLFFYLFSVLTPYHIFFWPLPCALLFSLLSHLSPSRHSIPKLFSPTRVSISIFYIYLIYLYQSINLSIYLYINLSYLSIYLSCAYMSTLHKYFFIRTLVHQISFSLLSLSPLLSSPLPSSPLLSLIFNIQRQGRTQSLTRYLLDPLETKYTFLTSFSLVFPSSLSRFLRYLLDPLETKYTFLTSLFLSLNLSRFFSLSLAFSLSLSLFLSPSLMRVYILVYTNARCLIMI